MSRVDAITVSKPLPINKKSFMNHGFQPIINLSLEKVKSKEILLKRFLINIPVNSKPLERSSTSWLTLSHNKSQLSFVNKSYPTDILI